MSTLSPRRRDDLVVDSPVGVHRIVHDGAARRYFRLGVREASFLDSLDGSRSIEDLRAANDGGFAPEQVDQLLVWFEAQKLLMEAGEGPAPTERKPIWKHVRDAALRPDKARIHLLNPNRLLDRCRPQVDAMFARPALGFYLLTFLLPVAIYIADPGLVSAAAASYQRPDSLAEFALLYVLIFAMVALHELAHAVTCKHFGGKVERIGLMFLYLNPVLYCDVSDSWRFARTGEKIAVAAAGIFFQSVICSLALAAWMFTGWSMLGTFASIGFVISALNFFPLIKLDGYWMLVHVLREPNLKQKSLRAVDQLLRRQLGQVQATAAPPPGLLAFGLGQVVAIPLFWIIGLLAMHRYASRLSPMLAMVLVALLAAPLAWRTLQAGRRYVRSFRTSSAVMS